MKKILLKILSVFVVFVSCFSLAGCLGTSTQLDVEVPEDIKGTMEGANDILMTKDNVTYYYNSLADLQADQGKEANERNNLSHTFADAYVFVDPGVGYEIYDHFSGENRAFETLIERQVNALADVIYTAINRIYIDGVLLNENSDPVDYKSYSFEGKSSNNLNVINFADEKYISAKADPNFIYLDNVYTFSAMAGLDGGSDGWKASITYKVEGEDTTHTTHILNTFYAPLGGFKLSKDLDGSYTVFEDGTEGGSFVWDRKWFNFNETYAWSVCGFTTFPTTIDNLQVDVKDAVKMAIASALSGVESEGNSEDGNFVEMLQAIDHLGCTETDIKNIVDKILNEIIGKNALDRDKECLEALVDLQHSVLTFDGDKIAVNPTQFEELFKSGEKIAQYYKGYEIVIDAIVRQAMNLDYTDENGFTETLLPEVPRVEIFKMDSYDLMDFQEEESEEEESGEDQEYIDDPENIKFTEKFGKFQKIVGILLTPKNVYGERTMAVKENGEWVMNDDGTVKLKTEVVEGFVLTGADTVYLSEDNTMPTVKNTFEIHTAQKVVNTESEPFDVGFVKPEPTEETTYVSTETVDIDKQEIIEKPEAEISEYRIKGYNGFSIGELGEVLTNEGLPTEIVLAPREEGKYTIYKMDTRMHKYLGVSDVNGDAGTNFAGYLIDVSNFAGDNYVLANIPILAVNEQETNRDAKLDILYFYLDVI